MVNNYTNPYYNPYAQQYQTLPQQQVVKVHGEDGARAYQMGANSSALLLDESGTIVWLAVTDGASYKTITPYDISPHKTVQPPDYSTLETRITRLEELINEHSNNTTAIKRKNGTKPTDSADDSAG